GEWAGGLPVAERRIARQWGDAVADDLVVVERSEARADDGLRVVERAISEADARREIVLVGLPQPPPDARTVTQQEHTVANVSLLAARDLDRVGRRVERGDLVRVLDRRQIELVTQSQIQRQFRGDLPIVLEVIA